MRIAFAGKGGVGKTTLAATLARLTARAGRPVVAIDADSNPNLAAALGADPTARTESLPAGLVSRRLDGPRLAAPVGDVLARWGVAGPDGVAIVRMGMPTHAGEGCLCAAHATISALLADLGGDPERVTVVDLEASPEHLSRGTARHVDGFAVVTEPYYRSLETARRLVGLAAQLPIPRIVVVANKIRSPEDADAVAAFCDRHALDLVATVPWSDAAVEADIAGVPLLERAGDEPAVRAVAALADELSGTVRSRAP